jgi:hypothetical protein
MQCLVLLLLRARSQGLMLLLTGTTLRVQVRVLRWPQVVPAISSTDCCGIANAAAIQPSTILWTAFCFAATGKAIADAAIHFAADAWLYRRVRLA